MFHSQIIAEIINLVNTKEKNDIIFSFSKKHYDLHQFNVDSLYPKDVKKMNESLKRRYKHHEIQILQTNWNQGERRLFVWFIICFLHQKKVSIGDITQQDLKCLSEIFYGKDTIFLDFQLRNLPKITKSKRTWSSEEDELIKKAIKTLKGDDLKVFNNWNDVAKIMFFQTERRIFRTPKSCRERWYNHLDESKKKDDFSVEEDLTLINFILKESKSWSKIVKVMNYSRTQHRIKNRYYTLIRKYQRSLGNSQIEEMTEEEERGVVLRLKVLLEYKSDRLPGLEEIQEESRKERFDGVKAEEGLGKNGQNREFNGQQKGQNKKTNRAHKVKTQTDNAESEKVSQIKFVSEQQIECRSLSSSIDLKESQREMQSQSLELKMMQPASSYWSDCGMGYGQYGYYMSMEPQMMEQVMPGPVIINQVYCPVYIPVSYQFYQQ